MNIGRITGAEPISTQIKPLKPTPQSVKCSFEPEAKEALKLTGKSK